MAKELPKFASGKRPAFFEDKAVDHLLAMVMELSTELAVVYGQQKRLESYLESKGQLDRDEFEAFELTHGAEAELEQWRSLFLDRLFHTVQHEAQTARREKTKTSPK